MYLLGLPLYRWHRNAGCGIPQCPATGEELTTDDLLELRSDKAVKPRPVEAASIPGLLSIMQVCLYVQLLTVLFSIVE